MSNINVNIELFGFLQDCSKQKIVSLIIPMGSSIAQIKQSLAAKLEEQSNDDKIKELPDNCVLSNSKEILFDNVKVVGDANLVALPPVCGG